jgi:hypothetical protein
LVQIDPSGRPFFYISHSRTPAVRQALTRLGFASDPSDEGRIVVIDELDPSDEGQEVVVFSKEVDADTIQDLVDELSWTMGRVVREVVP